ncbi:MAG: SDH family Clp fold serine proteinase [Desulfomonilia bacterium]|jgi:ClpP class serine protease|uniref:Serine dehydrogenase proteinase n=1 Tax=anaerobic digester metagenome TaxID=1263854 RepID=A0A485LWD3_9ZZZZ|nr:ATP-dependent Clp protease proteolytic subunit [Pseudomonadota bacterium]HON39254.1 ATP-dependent Clp protease proteolytic subunit [Deltaproteobacteria bacterium]HRS55406.1 ATP-dependent Clp protease proteolytic subunit [Desulfomonilia bacterium]HPD20475.1 ATP-dependent Clp protease proteolytic subunit [Deltaproteobacteria bacterium]HPX18833.1 ATP-dependent Clp protease proteolytic subunit [Deltaproteobacteria bacterium]
MNDIWNILWLLLIAAILIPVVQQKLIRMRRMRLIRAIEKKRNSRLITLIHRQEIMKFFGIPLLRYIDINDAEEILRAIRFTPEDMPIDMIVHTPGGLVLSSEQIAMALKRHRAKVTIFVPHYAMSGGTLLCLAADEVAMDGNAVLGPVDPQVGKYPAVSIMAAVEKKEPKDIDDETYIMADISHKALEQMREFVEIILSDQRSPADVERIVKALTEGRRTHDHPIFLEDAKRLGINVTGRVPDDIYRLMELFPQAEQQRPSVQYIPVPYKDDGREPKE